MKAYLLVITKNELNALGAIRGMPGIMVAENNYLYVKGIDDAMLNDKRVKQLPVLQSYRLDEEGRMFPLKGFTPVALLPFLQWLPIALFLKIALPVSALPGSISDKLPIRLLQSNGARKGCAILTSLEAWKNYIETTSAARIEHLQFAVAMNGEVLIMGTPLPAIPGNELYNEGEVLVPAGYVFEAPLVAGILHKKLNAKKNAVLLFMTSGAWHTIPNASFVKATRSGVRLTTIMKAE